MKTTKQLANEMADQVFQIRDACIEKKKIKRNRIMSVVKFAAPAAVCFGLALSFGINYWSNYSQMPVVEIQQGITKIPEAESTAPTHSQQSSISVASHPTTETTVSSADTSETQPLVEADWYEQEEKSDTIEKKELPAETKVPEPTEEPIRTTIRVTAPVIDDSDFTEYTIPRLLDSDDPISVFTVINYGGSSYVGCRYIKKSIAETFYVPWTFDTDFTAFDKRKDREVTEPVTIIGLRDDDEKQEYIVIRFNNYGLYGLYAAEETDNDSENESLTDNE